MPSIRNNSFTMHSLAYKQLCLINLSFFRTVLNWQATGYATFYVSGTKTRTTMLYFPKFKCLILLSQFLSIFQIWWWWHFWRSITCGLTFRRSLGWLTSPSCVHNFLPSQSNLIPHPHSPWVGLLYFYLVLHDARLFEKPHIYIFNLINAKESQ